MNRGLYSRRVCLSHLPTWLCRITAKEKKKSERGHEGGNRHRKAPKVPERVDALAVAWTLVTKVKDMNLFDMQLLSMRAVAASCFLHPPCPSIRPLEDAWSNGLTAKA
ncbi:unnamed protein product [Ectocarpus fasciculatus]